ncbi:MAG: SpoIID/LytB domain-containing protein, partial [Acidothermaceae bacterium]
MSFRLGLARFGVCGAVAVLVASLFSSSAIAAPTENSADTYLPPPTGVLTFTGHGWGHGIGMSQWGAYGAAQQGLSATQILDFYYPGTTRVDIDPKTPIRMLLGTDNGIDLKVSTVAADGALTFTDMATGVATPLPPTVAGAPVTGWRLAWANGVIQLQADWTGTFQPYPVGAPITTTGVARFTSATGIVRLMNPSGTQDDLYGSVDGVVIGGKLRTVETAGLDDILPSVLGKEMAANWPTAALQAQAVAARSYADFQIGAHASQPYDVSIPTDFAYEGIARYDASGNKVASWNDPSLVSAVTAFPGDVRSYGGRAIFAQFSSSNGGYTVAGTVSGAPVPYLIAKPDPYDAVAANAHNSWTANVPVSTVTAAYPTVGSLVSITVNSRDGNGQWGGRTLSITVNGSNGSVTDGATSFYQKLGLQSNWWNLPGSADPLGALEAVQTAPGGAQVTGWAFDPKTTAAIAVHLYVDGKMATAITANVNRPDLASQLTSGTAHGFSAALKLAPGTHSVCAFAINSQAGGKNPQLGCSNVTAYAGNPIGAVSISSGIGGVAVSGWTLDPESLGAVTVRITVDSKVNLVIPASGLDASLAATFSYYGQNHGFSWLLPVSGTHTVCVN